MIAGVMCGLVAGWQLSKASDERNPIALIVGLVFLGLSIWAFTAGAS